MNLYKDIIESAIREAVKDQIVKLFQGAMEGSINPEIVTVCPKCGKNYERVFYDDSGVEIDKYVRLYRCPKCKDIQEAK